MKFVICVFIGALIGILIISILLADKVSSLEEEIDKKNKEIRGLKKEKGKRNKYEVIYNTDGMVLKNKKGETIVSFLNPPAGIHVKDIDVKENK